MYCNNCGGRAPCQLVKLAAPCTELTRAGKDVLSAIAAKKLPPSLRCWPADTLPQQIEHLAKSKPARKIGAELLDGFSDPDDQQRIVLDSLAGQFYHSLVHNKQKKRVITPWYGDSPWPE